MKSYLIPQYSNQKSFNNKAIVESIQNGESIGYQLTSYTTVVASFYNGKLTVYNLQSATTLRHVVEFAQQMGLPKLTRKELEDKYFYQD